MAVAVVLALRPATITTQHQAVQAVVVVTDLAPIQMVLLVIHLQHLLHKGVLVEMV
jgi:hypothetical protein